MLNGKTCETVEELSGCQSPLYAYSEQRSGALLGWLGVDMPTLPLVRGNTSSIAPLNPCIDCILHSACPPHKSRSRGRVLWTRM